MKNINKLKIITGANGYIGSELSKFFKDKNFKVINFDKIKSKNVFDLDLKKRKDVNLFFKKKNISIVYHFGTY